MLDGVSQGGVRRGAGMLQFDINHPDILEIVRAKNKPGVLERMNVSIRVPDYFYTQLNDSPNEAHMVFLKDGSSICLRENGKLVTVQEVWNEIIKYAWLNAEPGIFNSDIATKQCTVTNISKAVLSNPCQPAFATVLTPGGIKTFGELNIGDTIWSGKRWTKVINKWFTGNKQVYSYNTTAGSFVGTENHRIVQRGTKIKVKDASSIDICPGDKNGKIKFNINAIMDGLVLGDGSVHKASNDLVYLNIGEDDYDYFSSEIKSLILKDRRIAFKTGWEVSTSIVSSELPKTYNREIPIRYYKGNFNNTASFLRGLYSANGSIVSNRITLKQTSLKLIKQVQEMLSSLGIMSYYTTNNPKSVEFNNGIYDCKKSYDLNITIDREIFYNKIGFIQKYKQDKLKSIIKDVLRTKSSYEIISIDDLGFHDVFDITVEADEHTYWTGGLLVSNCQEYVNIEYSSCNLGSINLCSCITDGVFDWNKFQILIEKATRFLNEVIDSNFYPLGKIEKITKQIRPIGLGVFGYAHMLYALGIPYNSPVAYELTEDIFNFLTYISMLTSVEIAREKHKTYPAFDYTTFMKANSRFFNKGGKWDDLKDLIKHYGIYNSCNTSIAPTGTISYIGNRSSSIEPVFALAYFRSIEEKNKEYDVVELADPIFTSYLYQNYTNEEIDTILKYVANNDGSCQGCSLIPEEDQKVFVVAGDLTAMEHLKTLGIIARNTSLSVSKTINLPETATTEEINDVYINAFKEGVIGVTVYRKGSRDAILNVSNPSDNKEPVVDKPSSVNPPLITPRERVLDGKTYKIKDPHGNVYVTCNYSIINGKKRPTEIFIFSSNENQEMYAALGKTLSAIMRRNDDISFIIDDLKSIKASSESGGYFDPTFGFIKSRPMHLGLILDEFIAGLEQELGSMTCPDIQPKYKSTGEVCPDCGADLVREGGCKRCSSCSWSLCG